MKTKRFLYIIILGFSFFMSCSDDEASSDCENVDLLVDFQTEQNAIADAQINHLLDPSDENCQILKDVLNDYLMKLKQFENCERSTSEEADYQEAIETVQSDLDNLSC